MKFCHKCNQYKDFTKFSKDRTTSDGFQVACKPCRVLQVRSWQKRNAQKVVNYVDKYQKKYPGKVNAKGRAYNLSKINRTPQWADLKAIEQFYINCPKNYEVDHIIPLNGKTVSGLHVLDNLQYLLKVKNRQKSNKFINTL